MSRATVARNDAAAAAYRDVRGRWMEACHRADNAFARYFAKLQAGEVTNGAAVARLDNAVNELSAVLYSAQSELFRCELDPWNLDDLDAVPRTPLGGSGYE